MDAGRKDVVLTNALINHGNVKPKSSAKPLDEGKRDVKIEPSKSPLSIQQMGVAVKYLKLRYYSASPGRQPAVILQKLQREQFSFGSRVAIGSQKGPSSGPGPIAAIQIACKTMPSMAENGHRTARSGPSPARENPAEAGLISGRKDHTSNNLLFRLVPVVLLAPVLIF